MRILVLSNFYPPHFFGGYELQCEVYTEALREHGHEVRVLTSQYGSNGTHGHILRHFYYINPADNQQNYPGWMPQRLARRYIHLQRAINAQRNYRIAQQVAQAFKPDIAFIWNLHAVEITPALAMTRMNIPTVYNLGDYWLAKIRRELGTEHGYAKRLYRSVYNGLVNFDELDMRYLQINSQSMKQHYISAGFAADSMSVIPRGIDPATIIAEEDLPPTFHERGDKTLRLLYAGRVDPDKGVHIAIEALSHLGEYPWRITLDIIGDGKQAYMEELQDRIQALGLEKRVSFLGHQPREKVLALYPKYDVSLLPAIWVEPFGNTVIESMSRGVPMIATAQGGPSETIQHGVNGLLVPPDDPKALADAIQRLITKPTLVAELRQGGLKSVREKYNYHAIVELIERELLSIHEKSRHERQS